MTYATNIPKQNKRFPFESLRHAFELGREIYRMNQRREMRRKVLTGWDDSTEQLVKRDERWLARAVCAELVCAVVILLLLASAISSHGQPRLTAIAQSLAAAPAVPVAGFNGQITLTWDASSNAVTYAVSYGTNRSALNQSIGVGSKTNVTIKGLAEAFTYYFAAYSYDTKGVESLPSNMVTNFIQPKMTLAAASYAVSMTLPRRTNVIEASTNMSTWRAIHTNTTGGIVTVTRPALVTGEFYRVR